MIEIQAPDSVEEVADWAELIVACENRGFSKSEVARHIEGSKGDEAEEGFISSVWMELENRQKSYKEPPFEAESSIITPLIEWKKIPEYMACLLFSVFGGAGELSKSAKIFEQITAYALKEQFECETEIFGWPPENGVSGDIRERIRNLAKRLNERVIETPHSYKKDDTLDVVAWKPFYDKRNSQLVILTQCAIGKNWETKTRSLRMEAWKHYIHWGCNPVPGFSVPKIIPDSKWIDTARDAGMLFDRIRIYNLLCTSEDNNQFRSSLSDWCREQLNKLTS